MNGLIKEITDYLDDRDLCRCVDEGIREILSRHSKDTEPLVLCAHLKGYSVQYDYTAGQQWRIVLFTYGPTREAKTMDFGDTVAAAEAKARKYLNGLPDVKGRE